MVPISMVALLTARQVAGSRGFESLGGGQQGGVFFDLLNTSADMDAETCFGPARSPRR